MPPTDPNVPSGSPVPTSNLAALTAQFTHSAQVSQAPSDLPPPAWALTLEQNLTASLTSAGNKICSGLVVQSAQERHHWNREQQFARVSFRQEAKQLLEEDRVNVRVLMRQLIKKAILIILLCASAVPITYMVTLLQYQHLDKLRTELRGSQEELAMIRAKIQALTPITRWQIVQGEEAPLVKILPNSVRQTPEGTFATPELKAEK